MKEILNLARTLIALPPHDGCQYWVDISSAWDKRKVVNAFSNPTFNKLATLGAAIRLIPATDAIVHDEQLFLAPKSRNGLFADKTPSGRGITVIDAITSDGEEIVVIKVAYISPSIEILARGSMGLTDLAGMNAKIWISATRKKFNAINASVDRIIPNLPKPFAKEGAIMVPVPFYYNPTSGAAFIRGLTILDQVEYQLPDDVESILSLLKSVA